MRRQPSIQQQHQQGAAENSVAVVHMLRPVQISSLGGMSIHVHGRDIGVQGWKSPRVYQLLSLIIAMGGKNIATHHICDAIYPDMEGDKGMQNLEFILRRLRQVMQPELGQGIKATQVICLHQGKVSLNSDYCDVDIWQWNDLCAEARQLRMVAGDLSSATACEQQAALMLSGRFLDGDDAFEAVGRHKLIWRERVCNWIDATIRHWRNDELAGYDQMMMLFEIWQNIDSSSERLCMQRMRVLLDDGYTVDAKRVYYAWVQQIKAEYGFNPSQQAVALSNRISKTLNNVIK
ncbi:bacterial transcriptional activator domain-containing protein [Mariprofundus ferrooxydans]|nr:bacterial transcriptional activator domain-containing protein [Mariprofundus ferrooxydans]